MFTLTHRYRELIEKKSSVDEFRRDDEELTEYVNKAIQSGGERIATIFGTDKPYFYYALALSSASLKMPDATEKELETITNIIPTVANLLVGIMGDVGLNENAQYTIVLGKEKQDE